MIATTPQRYRDSNNQLNTGEGLSFALGVVCGQLACRNFDTTALLDLCGKPYTTVKKVDEGFAWGIAAPQKLLWECATYQKMFAQRYDVWEHRYQNVLEQMLFDNQNCSMGSAVVSLQKTAWFMHGLCKSDITRKVCAELDHGTQTFPETSAAALKNRLKI